MTGVWLVVAGVSGVLLAVPWGLYPALTIYRARRRGPITRPAAPADQPLVSVILATRDGPARVHERLEDLLRTRYSSDRLEIIVAADGPALDEGFGDFPGRCTRVVLTRAPAPGGKAVALNAGVDAAQGEILVFADSHQRFDPDAIPRLVATLQQGPWSVVSGALTIGEAGAVTPLTRYWSRERRLREAEAQIHSAVGVTGAIYAMRRDRWTRLPAGLILDDLYVPMHRVLAGDRIGFEALALATDTRITGPVEEFRRKVRTLTGNIQLFAWLPRVLSPTRNPIWIQYACHKLLRLLTPYCVTGLALAAVGLGFTMAPRVAVRVLLGLGALLLLVGLSRDRLSRRIRSVVVWGLAMQAALVVATVNGLRGKWDVWR